MWTCPDCGRSFTRKNQRHACGTGDRNAVLRNRPQPIVDLYEALEAFVRSFGSVEFVTRQRYVLLRSTRVFADLVIMRDAVRVAIHLSRRVDDCVFFKIGGDTKSVTHVAKLQHRQDLERVKSYLKEAYECSVHHSP
jgi:hypothetical protein